MNDLLRTHEDVVDAVVEAFRVPRKQLLSVGRQRSVSHPRCVLMWVLRQRALSYPVIGEMLSRNHATIMSGCRLVESNPDLLKAGRAIAQKSGTGIMAERERLHRQRLALWRQLCGTDIKRRVTA